MDHNGAFISFDASPSAIGEDEALPTPTRHLKSAQSFSLLTYAQAVMPASCPCWDSGTGLPAGAETLGKMRFW